MIVSKMIARSIVRGYRKGIGDPHIRLATEAEKLKACKCFFYQTVVILKVMGNGVECHPKWFLSEGARLNLGYFIGDRCREPFCDLPVAKQPFLGAILIFHQFQHFRQLVRMDRDFAEFQGVDALA